MKKHVAFTLIGCVVALCLLGNIVGTDKSNERTKTVVKKSQMA